MVWHCRNVHPSTTLLQHVTDSQSPLPGVASVSSQAIHLLCVGSKSSDTRRELNHLQLAGMPTAMQHLHGHQWAIADTMADLWIISLGEAGSLRRVTSGVPLTLGHFMCLLSDPEAEAGQKRTHCIICHPNHQLLLDVFESTLS